MAGVAQIGAQGMLNHLTSVALPVIQGTAPTWFPGLVWFDSTTNPATLKVWTGSSWVTQASQGGPYLALLTQDPSTAVNMTDLVECTDSGYARQTCLFSQATATNPVTITNTSLIQFGPFNVNMSLPVQWVALVTRSSGTTGFLRQTWSLSQQWQVLATQVIDIPAGALTITQQ